jgi:hypothetical protein
MIQGNAQIFSVRNGAAQMMITNNAANPAKYNIGIFQQIGKKVWTWADNGGNGYDINTPYLIVMSYTNSSPSATNVTAELWINPALNSTPPATADIWQAQLAMGNPTNFYGFSNGNGNPEPGTEIYVDELRIGSTWSDVVTP